MTRFQLKAFFEWFQSQRAGRAKVLEHAMRETGFVDWTADHSGESLLPLGAWYVRQVEKRDLTPEEKEAAMAGQRGALLQIMPTHQLTDKTHSVAMDVGMYLGDALRLAVGNVAWEQEIGGKSSISYGHAVVKGVNTPSCDPVHLMTVQADSILRGRSNETSLHDLFQKWRGYLSTQLPKKTR